jgi:hypothetical protein
MKLFSITLALVAGSSIALGQTSVTLTPVPPTLNIQSGRNVSRTSTGTITPFNAYRYNIDLTVQGRGLFSILSFLIPTPRPLAQVITDLGGNPDDILTGVVLNPSATHPVVLFDELLDQGDIALRLVGGINASNRAYFEVRDIAITPGWGYLEVTGGTITIQHEVNANPNGACCLPSGTCEIRTESQCAQLLGTWSGANTSCAGITCVPTTILFSENFNSVPLGPNVDETLAGTNVWSGNPPAGWIFDDSGIPTVNDPAIGVTEWEGWAIVDRIWWAQAAGNQRRAEFTRASGAVAVADPDEWDDRGTPAPNSFGPYNALMSTPPISLAGVEPNSLTLSFDSSWRPEVLQAAEIRASFDGTAPITILRWDSVAGPTFKPDAVNEGVSISVANPAGAQNVRFTFGLLDAGNNWWWAIDNVRLTGTTSAPSCPADINDDGGVDGDDVIFFFALWDAGDMGADFNGDQGVDGDDVIGFFARWDTGC